MTITTELAAPVVNEMAYTHDHHGLSFLNNMAANPAVNPASMKLIKPPHTFQKLPNTSDVEKAFNNVVVKFR